MSSVRKGIDGISIANQVRLERATHAGSFLLVEGKGEEHIFRRFCNEDICSVVVCLGKPNVIEAIDDLGKSKFSGALAVVDRDYLKFSGYPKVEGEIIYTEENDFDMMIIASGALDKVMIEFGDQLRIAAITGKKGKSIYELVFSSASVIGALRMVAQQNDWSLKFSGMKYKFKPNGSFEIKEDSMVAHVYGRSKANLSVSKEEIRNALREALGKGIEAKELCCGHDCVRVLGRGLSKAFGKTNQFSSELGARTLEGILRLSYEWCTGLVFPRHSGSSVSDQAASFTTSRFSFGTMGGSLFRRSASRKACAGVRPLRR